MSTRNVMPATQGYKHAINKTHQWIMRPDPKKPWRKVKDLAPTTVFHNSKPAGQRKGTAYRKPTEVKFP